MYMSTVFRTVNKNTLAVPGAAYLCGNVDLLPPWLVSLSSATTFLTNGAAATLQQQTPEGIRVSLSRNRTTDFSVCFLYSQRCFVSAGEPNQTDPEGKKTTSWPSS